MSTPLAQFMQKLEQSWLVLRIVCTEIFPHKVKERLKYWHRRTCSVLYTVGIYVGLDSSLKKRKVMFLGRSRTWVRVQKICNPSFVDTQHQCCGAGTFWS